MSSYVLRRLLIAVPTLFGVTIVIFIAMRVLPGNPIEAMANPETGAIVLTNAQKAAITRNLGLDEPLYAQYGKWIRDIFTGSLGESFFSNRPIRDLIMRRAPITAEIAVMALILSWIIGVPAGVFSALRRGTAADHVTRTIVTFFMAVPNFWLGVVFIIVAVLVFSWSPAALTVYIWDNPVRNLAQASGPAVAMGLGMGAIIARMTRATVLEVLQDDYVRTARSKGLAERTVIWKHVLRNALIPVITISGLQLAGLLSGTVAVETAFGVPGIGAELASALSNRDWMVIQNLTLLFAVVFVLINLVVDLMYSWVDPRIRYD